MGSHYAKHAFFLFFPFSLFCILFFIGGMTSWKLQTPIILYAVHIIFLCMAPLGMEMGTVCMVGRSGLAVLWLEMEAGDDVE